MLRLLRPGGSHVVSGPEHCVIYEMTDALYDELANLPPESALQLVSKWLKQNNLARVADTLTAEVSEDPSGPAA